MAFIITKLQFTIIASVSVKYILYLVQSEIKSGPREKHHNKNITPDSVIISWSLCDSSKFDDNFKKSFFEIGHGLMMQQEFLPALCHMHLVL